MSPPIPEQATYETATTRYITVDNIKYAYRYFTSSSPSPQTPALLLLNHFRSNMDWWDPLFINPLAKHRPILLLDNAGTGRSSGEVGRTFTHWAQAAMSIVHALDLSSSPIDLFGFSMGGFAALTLAIDYPSHIRRLIIAGSGPSAGEGLESADPQHITRVSAATTDEDNKAGMMQTFFSLSPRKQALAAEWWERMTSSRVDRAPLLTGEGVRIQVGAAMRYLGGEHREEATYDRLDQIKIPVLVANGSDDVLVPTHNSYVLFRKLVNAKPHLHLYPDSGHGFLDEYHAHFSGLVNTFLDDADAE